MKINFGDAVLEKNESVTVYDAAAEAGIISRAVLAARVDGVVCALTKESGVKTTVSMNPIMIDGTGMCGGCRLTVGGKTMFACVDGPDFDGFEVDFDEAMKRGAMYRDFERHAYEETCNLFKKEAE